MTGLVRGHTVGSPALLGLRAVSQHRRRGDGSPTQRWVLDGGPRVVSGEQPGLARRWRHGRTTVGSGSFTVRAYRLGLRVLPMPPVTVPVAAIERAGEQHAGLGSVVTVRPGSRLVPVTTTAAGATLQLAVITSNTAGPLAALVSGPSTV